MAKGPPVKTGGPFLSPSRIVWFNPLALGARYRPFESDLGDFFVLACRPTGRTSDFGSDNRGSSPRGPANFNSFIFLSIIE